MRLARTAALMLMLLAGTTLTSCSTEEIDTAPVLRPVRYEPVYATGGARERSFSGVARAGVESELSFRVPGRVNRLLVKVGDRVQAGDLIGELDQTDYRLQVEETQASLEQAKAQSRNAAANYERIRALYENRNASRNDLDAARAADESAKAAVESVTKRLELAQSQLGYTRLKAPVDGAIAEVPREVSENVKAGEPIALLTSGSRMEVEVTIPEILIGEVREGDTATITFDALPGQTYTATVTEVGVASTGMVTTFPVIVVLDKEEANCRPGMAAQVAFQFDSNDPRERFLVPPVAVGEDRGGRFVFTVESVEPGVGVVHKRTVTTGELLDNGLEIFEGLRDGDLVLTAGVHKVADGMRVKLPVGADKTS